MRPVSSSGHITVMFRAAIIAIATTLFASLPAQALTLSSAELAAAQQLGCVLADDALGYLDENQFNARFDDVVESFSDEQVDVIYAKALGYIDGLLFGVPSGEGHVASRRLESFSNSESCAAVGPRVASHTVSL